ncbi:MAG: aminotransferase class I/II-fold pyridoxal phosphate-dependent enzyme [Rhodospirillales bacterium]
MALKQAKRGNVSSFLVMDVMRAAAEIEATGKGVLHLEVGQPGFQAPKGARLAAARALEEDTLGYTDAVGRPALRARIAKQYSEAYAVDVTPERISVTTGSSAGFLLAFLACFEAGDRVALADPSYPCYRNILKALDIETVPIPVGPETRYQPTPEHLEALGEIDGVVVASPSNPTGAMFAPGELGRLASWCHSKGVRLISDEIYHGLTYEQTAETAASSSSAIVINSFSKYYAMTGWRIGWMVLPEDLIEPINKLAQNFFISPPAISQVAALASFDCREELEANKSIYARNRKVLLDALTDRGLQPAAPPDGAFYIYVDASPLSNDSLSLCKSMLDEIGVAATSGLDFQPINGNRYIRFSFCASESDVAEAARRIRTWRT